MTISLKPDVLRHVVDVHCHPTDAGEIPPEAMESLEITICAMASMQSDQQRVAALAEAYPDKVIPCFDITSNLRDSLTKFPDAMVGEVGLDRSFRVPFDYFAEERKLTPFTIPVEHQMAILEAQLDLAVEFKRNASVHSVKAQQATVEFLHKLAKRHGESWYRISVDMHSCGFSSEAWRDIEKALSNVFLSVSIVINHKHPNLKKLIATCSPDRILVESDYNDVTRCTPQVLEMIELVSEVKGWVIEEDWVENLDESDWGAVRRLFENWKRFKEGGHPVPVGSKRSRKKLLENSPGSES
ncbi:hypothetical protein H1R20_g5199, partial [Candolleomyces eurysporus]